jgi:hypothetical protein
MRVMSVIDKQDCPSTVVPLCCLWDKTPLEPLQSYIIICPAFIRQCDPGIPVSDYYNNLEVAEQLLTAHRPPQNILHGGRSSH